MSYAWELKVWSRIITLNGKTATYYRPYLQHRDTLDVVTIQSKAWIDSVGLCMWADTLLGPLAVIRGRDWFVVWDNVAPHLVQAVLDELLENHTRTRALPPRTTEELQVMDLVVMAALKASQRRHRCNELFHAMQLFKAQRDAEMAKPQADRVLPVWTPPKPNLRKSILSLLTTMHEDLTKDAFKAGVIRSFVTVGLLPDDKLGSRTYRTYPGHGLLHRQHAGNGATKPAGDVLADAFIGTRGLETRTEDANSDDDDEEGSYSAGSDG